MEPLRETFNDGFLAYGYKETIRSESRKSLGSQFIEKGKLHFREISARDSDYQQAGLMGAKLDMKVKTMYPPSFRFINKSKLKIIIRGIEYDAIKVDPDNNQRYLYFYLQEVGGHSE